MIIKFCGKKTPLVRRKRRRTVHHPSDVGMDKSNNGLGEHNQMEGNPSVQIHPTAIEAAVPMGKKVRKGEGKSKKDRKRSKSRDKSNDKKKRKSSRREGEHEDDWASNAQGAVVSRAARLAANLSNLIVSLPDEEQEHLHDGGASPEVETEGGKTATSSPAKEKEGGGGEAQGKSNPKSEPTAVAKGVEGSQERKGRRRRRERSQGGGGGKSSSTDKRHSKSHSPEKTIAAGIRRSRELAERVANVSRSFEKLDEVVGGQRRRRKRDASSKRREAKKKEAGAHQTKANNKDKDETTIAKLGPFKFSLEKKQDKHHKPQIVREGPESSSKRRHRKRSSPKHGAADGLHRQATVAEKVEAWDATPQRANVLSPVPAKAPAISTRSVSLDNSPPAAAAGYQQNVGGNVMVSKHHQGDRPLRSRSQVDPPMSLHQQQQQAVLDLLTSSPTSLNASKPSVLDPQNKAKKFPRSMSYAGDAPLSELQSQQRTTLPGGGRNRKLSVAGLDRSAQSGNLYRLKRSTSVVKDVNVHNTRLGHAREDAFLPTSSRKTSVPAIVIEKPSAAIGGGPSRISTLKRHLQEQWDQTHPSDKQQQQSAGSKGTRSLNSTLRRSSDGGLYETIDGKCSNNAEDESDSSSDSKQRLSPPTQVQSLSEESLAASSTAEISRKSPNKEATSEFDSDDDDESDEDLVAKSPSSPSSSTSSSLEEPIISRKRILAAVIAEKKRKSKSSMPESQSQAELLKSDSTSLSSSSDGAAANTVASSSSSLEPEDEDKSGCDVGRGCDGGGGGGGGDNLDYVKRYGQVPRMLQGMQSGAPQEEDEDESISILND